MPKLMKGQKYTDRYLKGQLRYSYPVVVEEKRDEIRARFYLIKDVDTGQPVACGVESYAEKPLYNLDPQCAFIFTVLMREGLEELDCGIEVNGNFNDTYRYVRSKNGLPDELLGAKVVVLLFDIPGDDTHYTLRLGRMHSIVARAGKPNQFHRPLQWVAHSQEDEDEIYYSCRAKGTEGVMVKTKDHLYERTRSWGWYKRKPSETFDGKITRLVQAVCGKDQPELGLTKGDLLPRVGSVELLLEDGSTATPHGIPHDLGADMLAWPAKYLGQWAEFDCMERDRQGGYRHPVFRRLREEKA